MKVIVSEHMYRILEDLGFEMYFYEKSANLRYSKFDVDEECTL